MSLPLLTALYGGPFLRLCIEALVDASVHVCLGDVCKTHGI
jgi:hypothetical protein